MENNTSPIYSIVIPVYNEEKGIAQVLEAVQSQLDEDLDSYELVVVNDGSTDKTTEILAARDDGILVVQQPYNKGYGAALKAGVAHANGQWVLFYDGDGQHQPADIKRLIDANDGYDMVVGSRTGYQGPLWRQPGKKIITAIANYLVRFRIPDLNSGLRLVKKDLFHRFEHLYPQGFSLSTTITLALLKEGYSVHYLPIQVKKRIGKSTVRVSDGFRAINLVIRMIMLFSPLRIFLPLGGLMFVLALVSLARDVFIVFDINDNTVLLFVSALIIFSFGLIADQLAAIRRELRR